MDHNGVFTILNVDVTFWYNVNLHRNILDVAIMNFAMSMGYTWC